MQLNKVGVIPNNLENYLYRKIHVIHDHFGVDPPTPLLGIIIVINWALTLLSPITWLSNMCTLSNLIHFVNQDVYFDVIGNIIVRF